MEDVLEVYTRPYDPKYPVVCMDDWRVEPLPPQPASLEDYEYERKGVVNLFIFFEPLAG